MDVEQVRTQQAEVQLVDVRRAHEWDAGHIEGAIHIPLDELGARLGELDPRRLVVAVCRTGARSTIAVQLLRDQALAAENLDGGMQRWSDSGMTLVSTGGRVGIVAVSEDPGADELPEDLADLKDNLVGIWSAIQARFGSRQPTEEESRSFAIEWLTGKGMTADEAASFLDS